MAFKRKAKPPSTEIFSVTPEEFPLLAPQTRFRFSCQRCGNCCFDQLVLLTPQDLFRLSRAAPGLTFRSTTGLLEEGWVRISFLEGRWRCFLDMPRWFGARKCRFLSPVLEEDGKLRSWGCDLHGSGAKPLVCALSPVALAVGDGESELRLVAPTSDCPGMGRGAPYTLSEYLERARLADLIAFSEFFHRDIEPVIAQDEDLFRAAYDFDRHASVRTLDDLSRFLRSIITSHQAEAT